MNEKSRNVVIFTVASVACASFYFIHNQTNIQLHPAAAKDPLSETMAFMDIPDETTFANGVNHHGVTTYKYDRIDSGMSYQEVCEILGQPKSTKEPPHLEISTYAWQGSDGGVVEITFKNAQVVQKAQKSLNESTSQFTNK